MNSSKKIENQKDIKPFPELQAFVDTRKLPSIFVCTHDENLNVSHVLQLRTELGGRQFDEIDIVIQSGGGDIHAAYQMVELLRLHSKKINACVPFFAKSAATLLCIGADVIYLDELAQLGPLDTQIIEKGKGGKKDYVSALNPFKALEQMQSFAVESLDVCMGMIVSRSGMDVDECFKHGMEFVKATTGPLFSQLNPEKLGVYSRALSIGEEYGRRLLKRYSKWDSDKGDRVITKLVHGYPAHEYVIDYHELQELGFHVELFKEENRSAVQDLFKYLLKEKKSFIKLIDYVSSAPPAENPAQ